MQYNFLLDKPYELAIQSEVMLHSNNAKYRRIWRITTKMSLRIVGEYGPSVSYDSVCWISNNLLSLFR